MSTSPELFPNKYKPGGTITGVSGKLKGRIDKYGSDELWRWSWITLEGKKDKKITIITAYRVCPGNIHASDGTIWKQEWRSLTTPSQPTPDPRKQIVVDLATFVTTLQRAHHSILIFIDANDHQRSSPFTKFYNDLDLIDIIAYDRTNTPTATHTSGNRIDYIIMSPDLAAGTIASGILPLNHHIISDHRASYCDIDVQALFNTPRIEEQLTQLQRKLVLSKPTVVAKYLGKLNSLYIKHKIYTRLDDIVDAFSAASPSEYPPLIAEFNRLDKEKCRYMVAAHNQCNWSPPHGAYAWSPRLEKAGQTITYRKSRLARLRIPTPQPPFEQSIRVKHSIVDDDTHDITVIKHNILLAWANLRAIQKDSITIRDQHLHDLAEKYATNYGWTKETALRQMRL